MARVKRISECPEGIQVLLKKQFDIVGAPHDLELEDGWYHKYSWTPEQRQEFKDFFLDFVQKHPKRSDVISTYAMRRRQSRETAFAEWDLMYGWKDAEQRNEKETEKL